MFHIGIFISIPLCVGVRNKFDYYIIQRILNGNGSNLLNDYTLDSKQKSLYEHGCYIALF